MEYSEYLLGKEVYVTVSGGYYYKAILLGYGAYGSNPNHKTFCVQVIKDNGNTFVDYFSKIYSKEDYDKWLEEYCYNKYPFGKCQHCDKEFNSELINEYNIKYCPWCGEKINSLIGE